MAQVWPDRLTNLWQHKETRFLAERESGRYELEEHFHNGFLVLFRLTFRPSFR
jgi:hypothetical protein